MMRFRASLILLALTMSAFAMAPQPAAAFHCNPLTSQTVATGDRFVVVPLPPSVGPVTVGPTTVGGQTVGPVTLPLILTIQGVPVLGTVQVGGQTVGPVTVPSQTVGPVSTGTVPTGLNPITIIVHSQSATVPVDANCAVQLALEEVNAIVDCVRNIRTCVILA